MSSTENRKDNGVERRRSLQNEIHMTHPSLVIPGLPQMPPTDIKKDNGFKKMEPVEHEIQSARPSSFARASGTIDLAGYVRIWHLRLYRAALDGDWLSAEIIFRNTPLGITARDRVTKQGDTALHVAVASNHTRFVKRLVMGYMKAEDLVIQNSVGNTALHYAASSGNLELVKFMIERNKDLVMIPDKDDMLPLHSAALSGHEEIVWYLYLPSNLNLVHNEDKINLLVTLINSDLYNVALRLHEDYEELAVSRDRNGETALHALARKSTASSKLTKQDQDQQGIKFLLAHHAERFFKLFSRAKSQSSSLNAIVIDLLIEDIWSRVILLDDYKIAKLIGEPWSLIFVAAAKGNSGFLKALINQYPDIIREVDINDCSIFHIDVLNRQMNIFKLIYDIGPIKDMIISTRDKKGNTILHLAGMLPPPDRLKIVLGAALQMQREVLWFKEVSKIVRPSDAEAVNKKGKTPRSLFAESHKNLKKEGEKWMKDTANSCMVVATLVATVVFAAAFTIPGGSKQDTGAPNFLKELSFKIVVISDAVSLIFSSVSILSFLSILTSNYEEEDFFSTLPRNLVVGIASLFLSIGSMMVVFCATSFILFHAGTSWNPILITVLASIPVIFFIRKHYRFFVKTGRAF